MIKKLVWDLHQIAEALVPFMPKTAAVILAAIIENKKPDNLFARLE